VVVVVVGGGRVANTNNCNRYKYLPVFKASLFRLSVISCLPALPYLKRYVQRILQR